MNLRSYLFKSKNQLIITISGTAFISLILFFVDYKEIYKVSFSNEQLTDLGLLLVQINSITVGLLTAFYFFRIQTIESQKLTYFLEFKKTVNELINYKINLPTILTEFDEPISEILNLVASTDDEDFPYGTDEWKTLQRNTKKIISKSKTTDPLQGKVVLNILADIEFFASKIGLMIISGWLSDFLRNSITKQILLIVSLLILLILLSINLFNNPIILITTSIFFTILTANSLFELLFFILDYSENLNEMTE